MADLTPIANRMNDVEINANKPLTASLFQKFGSNINLLLDFLGISNGTTSATGTLSDLVQAVEFASTHTMSLEATFATGTNGTQTIGTFTHTPYLSQIFYPVINNQSGFSLSSWAGVPASDVRINFDSAGVITLPDVGDSSGNSGVLTGAPQMQDLEVQNFSTSSNQRLFTRSQTVSGGQSVADGVQFVCQPCIVVSPRDYATDFSLQVTMNVSVGNLTNLQFYRAYALDIGSIPF